jgi:hypothetical protein
MATNNQVNVGLSGSTGTGNFVGGTSPTITTPSIVTSINDTNNNNIINLSAQASAVNYMSVANAATGFTPEFGSSGSDANISMTYRAKGTGNHLFITNNTTIALRVASGTSAQHGTQFVMADTAATRTVTFPDADGTVTLLGNSSTGSGSVVLATSPSLTTPTLGVASATSVNFGQDALNYYDEGTWTPTDASGAALSLTVVAANYTRIGRYVVAMCNIAYPATADASSAVIGGLPFTAGNAGSTGGYVAYSTASTAARILTQAATTTAAIYSSAGAAITNVAMSGSANFFVLQYFV